MAATTRLGAVQDAILARLAARPALAQVQRGLGRPALIEAGEAIWVSDEAEARHEQRLSAASPQLREEELTVHVIVLVAGLAGYAAQRDRLIELLGECEQAIVSDPTLGGLVHSVSTSGYRTEETVTPKGRIAIADLSVVTRGLIGTP